MRMKYRLITWFEARCEDAHCLIRVSRHTGNSLIEYEIRSGCALRLHTEGQREKKAR